MRGETKHSLCCDIAMTCHMFSFDMKILYRGIPIIQLYGMYKRYLVSSIPFYNHA